MAEIWYHVWYFQLSQYSCKVQSWRGIEYTPSKIHIIEVFLPCFFSWKLQQTPENYIPKIKQWPKSTRKKIRKDA